MIGLKINEARPHDKLPYRGAWLWVGSEMIHLMELPNPDPYTGRPEHGGRDRHTCIAIRDVSKLKAILDKAGMDTVLGHFFFTFVEISGPESLKRVCLILYPVFNYNRYSVYSQSLWEASDFHTRPRY